MANISKVRLSGITYTIVDETAIHSLEGYATSAQTQSAITAATNALAEAIAEQHYQTSGDVQNAISGKADTSALTVFADSVVYNSTSEYIEFYNGGTGGTKVYEISAAPFLIDGMVQSVEITSITSGGSEVQVLEITWNSAAGGQVTDIPLTDIFNPSQYYTKTEVDTALSGKQETLVSGTNIKTINNQSILGSGDIHIEAQGVIDTQMSSTSENAVQNKVIKAYADTKNPMVTLDNETLVIS